MNPEILARYADVAVRVGANLQPGQPLFVTATVEHVALARAVAEAGWRTGAADVQIYYKEPYERYLLAKNAADKILPRSNGGRIGFLENEFDAMGASVNIIGDTSPRYFEGAAPERVAQANDAPAKALSHRIVNELREAWVVIACPEPSWAERVFGAPDVDRLAAEVAHACRLDERDPVAAWEAHLDRLEVRRSLLDERAFDRLHFRGPGTDLTVGLLPQSRWLGGRARTHWGQPHCSNLPTEEVFTTPHRLRTEGTVRGTRPVSYEEGVLVDGIELRFRDGDIVEARAARGERFLRRHLETDMSARRLGEVALVARSRVGERGLLFYNTLFDENAAPHLAYGMGYTEAVDGAVGLGAAALEALGVNASVVHTDIPVGGADVAVDGIDRRGERVPILAGEEWLLL